MNLKQFRYLLTLANEGSFSRAAELLNIKQPSLSQYVKKVEKEVGMELFDRSCGDVRLTEAGHVYIDIGRKILDLEHQMEDRLSDLAAFNSGSIIVGISAHRSVALMPSIVKAFKSRYPGITLKIVEKGRADLIEAAGHGEFDLVVTTLPVNTDIFTYETLFVEENVVAMREAMYGEIVNGRKFPIISASALNNLPFAMLNENHLMQRELEELVKANNLHLRKEVECTSLETLVEMIKAGIGSAFIPACLAKDSDLHYYSIKETVPIREIVVMYRKEQYLSIAVQELKKLMHEMLE